MCRNGRAEGGCQREDDMWEELSAIPKTTEGRMQKMRHRTIRSSGKNGLQAA